MNPLINTTPHQMMTSREIADLCQKRHDNVMQVIRDLISAQILTPEIQESSFEHRGNSYKCFLLNKRDSLVTVARLSPEFTAAVVDRWQELESQRPPTRLEMAHMLVEAETRCVEMEEKLALATPKVDYYDHIVDRTNLLNATQVAQKVKLSAFALNKFLDGMSVYSKSVKRSRAFQQWFINKGYGEVRQTENGHPQAMFTLAGEAWVIEKLISAGVIAK
ncbi:MAG: Rha family transcriptional regulator [Pseudomonadota bacterium]|nr:Rha family transcriptional regulator [Pseudomonadota bacterium]